MRKIIYFVVLVLPLSACEDVIDVELRSVAPQLVIEGVIRMDENAEVIITKTKDFGDDNTYPPITDALVVLTDDADKSEVLKPDASGKFRAPSIKGVEKRTYHLKVTYNEVTYTATAYMPPRVEIDSITVFRFPVSDSYHPQIHFVDPLGEENQYYRFVIGINDEWPTNLYKPLMSTEFVDGLTIHDPVFVNYDDDTDDDPIENGDKVTIEMQCMDKGMFTFFETLSNIDMSAANPTSNINGGALGYFGAYSFTRKEVVMKW